MAPQRCKCCSHPDTKKIDQEIVQGTAHTKIADSFGLDHQSVRYHAEHHLPEKLVKAVQEDERKHAESVLDGINDLLTRTRKIMDEAEQKGYNRLQLEAIREARSTFELLSRIAATMERFKQQKDETEDKRQTEQYQEGLKALSDNELHAYITLVSKIYSANPDIELDETTQYIVDQFKPQEIRRTTPPQHKNTQSDKGYREPEPEQEEPLDNLDDDFDLDLDDLEGTEKAPANRSTEIPSPDSDPEWMKRERRRHL